jgi:lysophospholipase L1-like esterase
MKLNVIGSARAALQATLLASLALIASCGGGGTPASDFHATRVIAFGDETSVITADHKKYSVNAVLTDGSNAIDCVNNLIWIQYVASIYGLVFPECANGVVDPVSRIYATNGAKVADLSGQIDQHINNGGGFTSTDIVTVLVGANDIVAQFAQYPGLGEPELLANLDAAGTALADQVNRIAALGAKVLVSTAPNMGLTPFAGDRSVNSTDGNPALLTRLSTKFNDALLARLTNDGHQIGLIQLDEYLGVVDNATRLGSGTFTNTTLPSCAVALPDCTTNTLVPDAVNLPWLWSDGLHLSATGQTSLGSLAVARAQNNPF